jgi:hypothetical protein
VVCTFNNTGTVLAQSGTLELAYGGSNSGVNSATGSGILDFGGGTHTLDASSSLTGDGTIGVSSGIVNFGGSCAMPGGCRINGGTLNVNAPITVGSVAISSGTLGGSGLVSDTGPLTWTGGTLSGWLQCNGGTINGSSPATLNGGRLVNTGVLTLTGSYYMHFGNGAVFTNAFGATFDVKIDQGLSYSGIGTYGAIYNAGLFRKSGGLGACQVDCAFNSTGTVEARSGIIQFQQSCLQTAGVTRLLEGRLQADRGFMLSGGVLAGTNVLLGNVTNRATVSPGASPGRLSIAGSYTETPDARLQIEIGGPAAGTDYDQLTVSGTATLAGTLAVSLLNGFVPAPDNMFTVLVHTARSGTFSAIQSPEFGCEALYPAGCVVLRLGNVAPRVTLVADPLPIACHTFLLRGRATDPDGTVTNLDLLLGTNLLASFRGGAGQVTVSHDFPGVLTLTGRATDNEGAIGSTNLAITVVTLPGRVLDPIGFQTNHAFKLCLAGEAGTNYTLLASTNLSQTNWIPLGVMEQTNGIWRFLDASATNQPVRFYRAQPWP